MFRNKEGISARSINYYPINDELAEEGTVSLALGLGKYIVDGGLTCRICCDKINALQIRYEKRTVYG